MWAVVTQPGLFCHTLMADSHSRVSPFASRNRFIDFALGCPATVGVGVARAGFISFIHSFIHSLFGCPSSLSFQAEETLVLGTTTLSRTEVAKLLESMVDEFLDMSTGPFLLCSKVCVEKDGEAE